MTDEEYLNTVINLAKRCGCLILETGGETYRAEETVLCICHSFDLTDVSVIAMTTGVMLSGQYKGHCGSAVGRISTRKQNLDLLDRINEISHQIARGKLSVDEASLQVEKFAQEKTLPFFLVMLSTAICTSAFCGLFGGEWPEIIIAFLAGVVLHSVNSILRVFQSHSYFMCIIGGITVAFCAVIPACFFPSLRISHIIIGGIMPLVPGVALTNSLRDLFTGDLISGITRLSEALFIAICIASGTGIVLFLYSLTGGLIL